MRDLFQKSKLKLVSEKCKFVCCVAILQCNDTYWLNIILSIRDPPQPSLSPSLFVCLCVYPIKISRYFSYEIFLFSGHLTILS